ncbi:MAG: DUF6497 family protein [Pseudomonadota bacterium]
MAKLWQSTRDFRIAGHAAPSGRTLATGGWGCILSTLSAPALAFDVPSGQALSFQESFYERKDDGALWARFRFVMPVIGTGVTYADVAEDFLTLCEAYVLPALAGQDMPDQIIVSLADRATDFGKANPEATQYFEAFTPDPPSCIWEGF